MLRTRQGSLLVSESSPGPRPSSSTPHRAPAGSASHKFNVHDRKDGTAQEMEQISGDGEVTITVEPGEDVEFYVNVTENNGILSSRKSKFLCKLALALALGYILYKNRDRMSRRMSGMAVALGMTAASRSLSRKPEQTSFIHVVEASSEGQMPPKDLKSSNDPRFPIGSTSSNDPSSPHTSNITMSSSNQKLSDKTASEESRFEGTRRTQSATKLPEYTRNEDFTYEMRSAPAQRPCGEFRCKTDPSSTAGTSYKVKSSQFCYNPDYCESPFE